MAAIAGVFRLDGAPAGETMAREMLARMAHRAPDGTVVFVDGPIALAHGALHATPESVHERQPVRIGERWVLVVDGRIDNRAELARMLGIDSTTLREMPDAELFAHAWGQWGEAFWPHVTGDFALAAWDREQARLVLLRDRVGVRPLFYTHTASVLAFASEAEALPRLDGVEISINELQVAASLSWGFRDTDKRATWYRGVQRLLPGERLRADHAGLEIQRYWSLQPAGELRLRDPREYVDAFRAVYEDAVACRLRSVRRPALMLSGGIDSASVLAAANCLHGRGQVDPILPISVLGVDPGCEETRNMLLMLGGRDGVRLGTDSLATEPGFAAYAKLGIERAVPAARSALLQRLVVMAAQRAGSNVLLDGIDGDLVMLTEDRYAGRMVVRGHLRQGWREACMASRVNTYLQGVSPIRILFAGMAAVLEPAWLSSLRYRYNAVRRRKDGVSPLLDRRLVKRLRLRELGLSQQIADRRRRAGQTDAEDLVHTWWHPGFTRGMERFDQIASGFGVEARHPWCDLRVLEFFLALPEEYKVRDGWTKWVVRAAYAESLGQHVAWHRGKDHLGPAVTRAVLLQDPQRVADLLERSGSVLDGLLDAGAMAELRDAWSRRDDDVDFDAVLEVVTLVSWVERLEHGVQANAVWA